VFRRATLAQHDGCFLFIPFTLAQHDGRLTILNIYLKADKAFALSAFGFPLKCKLIFLHNLHITYYN